MPKKSNKQKKSPNIIKNEQESQDDFQRWYSAFQKECLDATIRIRDFIVQNDIPKNVSIPALINLAIVEMSRKKEHKELVRFYFFQTFDHVYRFLEQESEEDVQPPF